VLASFITPFFVDCEGVARELVKVHEMHKETPFLVCLMTNPLWAGTKRILEQGGLPTYYFPESAARVAAALARVGELKARTEEEAPALQVDAAAAAKILGGAPAGLLPADRAAELLRAYGIPVAAERFCEKAADLPAAAKALGWPVVLKGHAEGLTHKTEAGAVAVGLADEASVRSVDEESRPRPSRVGVPAAGQRTGGTERTWRGAKL
jgi:acyl-CoA synthetase (NDP forming)